MNTSEAVEIYNKPIDIGISLADIDDEGIEGFSLALYDVENRYFIDNDISDILIQQFNITGIRNAFGESYDEGVQDEYYDEDAYKLIPIIKNLIGKSFKVYNKIYYVKECPYLQENALSIHGKDFKVI